MELSQQNPPIVLIYEISNIKCLNNQVNLAHCFGGRKSKILGSPIDLASGEGLMLGACVVERSHLAF
jgi:hypothetical protein